jgi:hypothetical protein
VTTHVAVAKMTEEEMVALVKKHTLFEWSAQSKSRSLACSESQGHLFLDARREALHRMELVRNRKTREQGLYTFVRWNTFFTNPPLCI